MLQAYLCLLLIEATSQCNHVKSESILLVPDGKYSPLGGAAMLLDGIPGQHGRAQWQEPQPKDELVPRLLSERHVGICWGDLYGALDGPSDVHAFE